MKKSKEKGAGKLLFFPKPIIAILKEFAKTSGTNTSNIIYNATIWWLVSKNLLSLDYIKELSKIPEDKRKSKYFQDDNERVDI